MRENLEPGVAFSKFVEDAARATCTEVANREILGDGQAGGGTSARAHLLLKALPADTLGNNEAAIRANMVALAERFWGVQLAADHSEVDALVAVFRAGSNPVQPASDGGSDGGSSGVDGGLPSARSQVADGSRGVCIALATDPQFYVY